MKEEEKILEHSTQEPVQSQKESGIALANEELSGAAGGERWWEWGNEPVNPVPGNGSKQNENTSTADQNSGHRHCAGIW